METYWHGNILAWKHTGMVTYWHGNTHIYVRYRLHWLPVKQRIKFKIYVLVFKCRLNEAPVYLSEMLYTVQRPTRYNRVLVRVLSVYLLSRLVFRMSNNTLLSTQLIYEIFFSIMLQLHHSWMNKTIQNFREPVVVGFEDKTASVVAIEPTPLNVVAAKSHLTQSSSTQINMVISMS